MSRKTDITPGSSGSPPERPRAERRDVDAFLEAARGVAPAAAGDGQGRLVFALDATMSRQPTWDLACDLQASMFDAAARAGGLSVQLAYFRGHAEARASRWVRDARSLKHLMTGIACHGGLTQIGRILDHVAEESAKAPLAAMVYVGDAMEEDVDRLCHKAGALALNGVKAFMFLEGRNAAAERAYREIARLTGGAFLPFDARAAGELQGLLGAVATYAAGGRKALEASGTEGARRLLGHMRR